MNQDYIIPNEWSIIEEGLNPENITSSESLFSLGNGTMGHRANFEEDYSGNTLQGSYVGGIYYPDKTRVGWWKNGYPAYFAKVLNAPNWIGIRVSVNNENLDLNKVKITNFRRELNMKEGWLLRTFKATFSNGNEIDVFTKRFLSLDFNEIGAIKYSVKALNFDGEIKFTPYLDGNIKNQDANYDEIFWETLQIESEENSARILSKTLKTNFQVSTGMQIQISKNDILFNPSKKEFKSKTKIEFIYTSSIQKNDTITIYKYGGYTSSLNHDKYILLEESKHKLEYASKLGFNYLLERQQKSWSNIWETSDIIIKGDLKAQQAIRYNIFQLNQTYSGKDSRLNIGPKGFTGEKYGGSTYWDTEAYCIPFYLSTKNKEIAKNLLLYRYNQLDKAIENAKNLGFKNGAALYPMVTMNGEECHNEWEITFEEIHRNGAIIYAIYNYVNYTNDFDYLATYGIEVMIAVARFWHQRANYSKQKKQYVILGVTGPNEYENNVNNNFYTNYLAKWCIEYTLQTLDTLKSEYASDYKRVFKLTQLTSEELNQWQQVAENMYFPFSKKLNLYLQQEGFLDKEINPANRLPKAQRPINQHWSWDRILRSCYIKQADVLQCIYFFENQFKESDIKNHFDFYEPITVHESSLSPCIHSILAAKINNIDKAYEMYLRTSRLDLDDYNNEVAEGCHITSMAGTWLAITQGFGGMRNFDNTLSFNPQIPQQWQSYSFKINYRGVILKIYKDHEKSKFSNLSDKSITIKAFDKSITIKSQSSVTV